MHSLWLQCGTGIGYMSMSSEHLRPSVSRGRDPWLVHSGRVTQQDKDYLAAHDSKADKAFQAWIWSKGAADNTESKLQQ